MIKVCGCMESVSVSGSQRCWHTCGQVGGHAAGVKNNVSRICGQRRAMTWRLKHAIASVAVVTFDRSVMLAMINAVLSLNFSLQELLTSSWRLVAA